MHQIVRERTGREMERQKKLYDRGKATDQYMLGTKVWEGTEQRKKWKSPKLQRKWKGPRLMFKRYSDVTYLMADGSKRPPRVVHFYRLKEYRGDKHPGWMNGYLA